MNTNISKADLHYELNKDIKDVLDRGKQIASHFLSKYGIKSDSDLIKTMEVEVNKDTLSLEFNMNYYSYYVDKGRKKHTKRVPLKSILNYCKAKGIKGTSKVPIKSIAFAIQTSIYNKGIKPKPFIDKLIEQVTDIYADILSDSITNSIIK